MSATAAASTASTVSVPGIFLALMRRDVRVARRELPIFLVRTTLQPLFFIIVFGYLLPRMGFIRGEYTTALLPGIVAMSLTFASIQSVTLPMVQDFGWTREIEDRLLAPVPVWVVAAEKVTMGVLQGFVAAIVVMPLARLIMGPIDGLTLANLGTVLVVTTLGAAAFSALGLLMGSIINPEQIGLMFSIIIAPMIFFGCAYYPWRGLDAVPAVKYLVLVNPLVYVAEGMRAALTPGVPHMPLGIVLAALVVLFAVFWTLGIRSFVRRAIG